MRNKIAVFNVGRTNFGGAERRLGRTFNQISQDSSYDITFVFYVYDKAEKVIEGFDNILLDKRLFNVVCFSDIFKLFTYTYSQRFDVVFVTGPSRVAVPFYLAAKIAHSKLVFCSVSTESSNLVFDSFLEKLNFNTICKLSNIIDCLYPSSIDLLKKEYGDKVLQTPCPFTDLNIYKPEPKKKQITFVGRWVQGKNVDIFVESILKIQDELYRAGYKIILAGNLSRYPMTAVVENMISSCKYEDLFEVKGYVKPEEILPQSEAFVSIQSINNYPSQSLLEAIASGCYIIASDEGDTKLLVKNDFGCLCKLDVSTISEAILSYFERSEEEKKKDSEAARNFALKTINIENSVTYYKKIIQDLI